MKDMERRAKSRSDVSDPPEKPQRPIKSYGFKKTDKMITFLEKDNLFILEYKSDRGDPWAHYKLEQENYISLKNTYYLPSEILYEKPRKDSEDEIDSDDSIKFIIGTLVGDYYKIAKNVLSMNNDLFIFKDMYMDDKSFTAIRNISIFSRIDSLINQDIYLGGPNESAVAEEDFQKLIQDFPNSYELRKYADARISTVLKNYFDEISNAEDKYNKYLNKKATKRGANLTSYFCEFELFKFEKILEKLKEMLRQELNYNETQWQAEILEIILLLFPKYIFAATEVPVIDSYFKTTRSLDFMLVTSSGNIDIIEIKKPFNNCILTKNTYRDNYIPLRELSGTIMQIEKYIYNLNKWGVKGEKFLTEKYSKDLPENFTIKIINPSAIIVMGREDKLTKEQLNDFEIIKRKYKNVIDIITYDDLIKRLEFSIEQIKNSITRHSTGSADSAGQ